MKKMFLLALLPMLAACQSPAGQNNAAAYVPYPADVVIDAGGDGAVNHQQNAAESLVLALAQDLKIQTNNQGLATYLTRSGEYRKPVAQRVADADKRCRGVLVALTIADHSGDSGISVAVPPQSEASTFYERNIGIANVLRQQLHVAKPLQEVNNAVLKNTACPSVLVQLGQTDNPSDQARLSNPNLRLQFAQTLANGIGQALKK